MTRPDKNNIISISYKEIFFFILISAGLYIVSFSGFLLFHGLIEVFSIAVAICIFMIALNSRYILKNNYLLFIGISLLFTAAIDLLHTFAYKGMGVFSGYDTNLSAQLWIAARYLQSISLLIAPLFLRSKLKLESNINYVFFIYSIVLSLLIASIFYWKNFPDCFIEGKGLTTFKIVSEYVISLIMAASIFFLYKKRKEFDENVFYLLVASIIILIFSEISFSAYVSIFGFSIVLGHLFKFIAYYLIYKAIIVTGFMKPYDLIFRDLKKSEEELIKHRDHLKELVKGRTAELEIARDRALESDRLKSAFLGTMSHELRTPLNSILGFSGILLQGFPGHLNDEQKKQMNMVNNSAKHLLLLVEDILDVSIIESGQLKVNIAIFDMTAAMKTALKKVTPLAEKKGVSIHVEVVPQEIMIQSDQKRVEQIIFNLLGNAIKFTEKGEVKVECHVSEGQVITRIIDTGIGIKPEHMDRLFKTFIQLDDGLSRRYEGTGLGLFICKKLVEMLGGSIEARSEYGKGSVFSFTLPLKK